MNTKTVLSSLGASAAASLVAIGTVVIGASAQASTTTPPPATANPPAAQSTPNPSNPTDGSRPEMPHMKGGPGHGRGEFGPGAFGGWEGGPKGAGLTADGANRQITNTTNLLTTAKTDLTYATGKMDTASVQKWLTSADTLLKDAQTAVTATKFGRAGEDAQAAMELIRTAEGQMAQTLGADKLPSASQRPQGRMGHMPGALGSTTTTPTQAQASRVLSQTYKHLVAQKATTSSSDAVAYLTDAQNAYQSAYTAYNAGKYTDAVSSARLAEQLAGVAQHVQAAADAPDNADTAVPVPAPKF